MVHCRIFTLWTIGGRRGGRAARVGRPKDQAWVAANGLFRNGLGRPATEAVAIVEYGGAIVVRGAVSVKRPASRELAIVASAFLASAWSLLTWDSAEVVSPPHAIPKIMLPQSDARR